MYIIIVCGVEDLSPGSVEEAEEAEPDDEFKDAIEVKTKSTVISALFLHVLLSDWFFISLFGQVLGHVFLIWYNFIGNCTTLTPALFEHCFHSFH